MIRQNLQKILAKEKNLPMNSLVSDALFREMGLIDFSKINGIEEESGFQTSVNISLLDEFKFRANFQVGSLSYESDYPYTNNIGFEDGA